MLHLDLHLIAKILGATLQGKQAVVKGVSIDSRKVRAGELFFAIPGERVDPHQFLDTVLASGAAAAVVEKAQPTVLPQLIVDDAYQALGKLAKFWREQFSLPIIGLTGSNGKTSLKNMIASILLAANQGDEDKVLYNHGNLNSGFGLPLTLLRLQPSHRVAVLEMGMSSFGEIDYISQIARPQVAVINNVFPAHVEGLGSLENIAEAKAEIFNGLNAAGVAVLNRDDAFFEYWHDKTQAFERVSFGLGPKATIYATDISDTLFPGFILHTPLESATVQLNVMGKHNVKNALAATAAAYALAIPLETIVEGLEAVEAVSGRLREIRHASGAIILDDAYNSNPGSLRAGIDVLVKHPGKHILVMGDMKELGSDEIAFHQQIAYYAADAGVDTLLAYGPLSLETADLFKGDSMHFDTHEELITALQPLLHTGVTVLVKGSNSMNLAKVVNAVAAQASKVAVS